MKTNATVPDYKGFRFSLSFRDVEELLAQRGIVVTDETVRQWCLKFGQTYANELRRRRPRYSDTWHLDAHVPEDQRENALYLEGRRSGWQRIGYPRPEQPE